MALTNKEITSLKTDKDIMVGDGNGLYLEVSKTGVKRWWFRYQFNSKPRKMPIDYFPAMSLAEARLEAARLRAILRDADNPQDPMEVRNTAKLEAERQIQEAKAAEIARQQQEADQAAELASRLTLKVLFQRWRQVQLSQRKDGGEEIERAFIKDVFPVLGECFVEDITRKDISLVLTAIVERGSNRMANRTLSDLRQCFGFGIGAGLLDNDPTSHLKKAAFGGKEHVRDRILSEAELCHLLVNALTGSNLQIKGKAGIRVLLATAARVSELLRAERSHIDFDKRTWTIPDEHAKNGNEHVIHLSNFAAKAFMEILNLEDHPVWLFPDRKGDNHIDTKTLTKQIADRQRLAPLTGRSSDTSSLILEGGKWTPHDLRRTAATLMGELGVLPHVIEKCLNHTEANRIVRTYQRQRMMEEQKAAFEMLGEKLEKLLDA